MEGLEKLTREDREAFKFLHIHGNNSEFSLNQVSHHLVSVAKGSLDNYKYVNKFGRAIGFGTSIVDINDQATPGVYTWLQAEDTVNVVSSAASDAAGGAGARTIIVQGLDGDFDEVEEEITLDGANPVTSTQKFIRVHRAYIGDTGSYAKTNAGTQTGNITVTDTTSGGVQIYLNGVLRVGQSFVARYTIPRNWTGYLFDANATARSLKATSFFLWRREGADVVSAPYTPKRAIDARTGIVSQIFATWEIPIKLPEKTDIWMSAQGDAAGSDATGGFTILLVRNET